MGSLQSFQFVLKQIFPEGHHLQWGDFLAIITINKTFWSLNIDISGGPSYHMTIIFQEGHLREVFKATGGPYGSISMFSPSCWQNETIETYWNHWNIWKPLKHIETIETKWNYWNKMKPLKHIKTIETYLKHWNILKLLKQNETIETYWNYWNIMKPLKHIETIETIETKWNHWNILKYFFNSIVYFEIPNPRCRRGFWNSSLCGVWKRTYRWVSAKAPCRYGIIVIIIVA